MLWLISTLAEERAAAAVVGEVKTTWFRWCVMRVAVAGVFFAMGALMASSEKDMGVFY
jgi:hypothetical protein